MANGTLQHAATGDLITLWQDRTMNAHKLRISLAVVTLAGAFHLDSARAAEPAGAESCDPHAAAVYATAYANAVCGTKGQKAPSVTYTCNADGTVSIHLVTCVEQT